MFLRAQWKQHGATRSQTNTAPVLKALHGSALRIYKIHTCAAMCCFCVAWKNPFCSLVLLLLLPIMLNETSLLSLSKSVSRNVWRAVCFVFWGAGLTLQCIRQASDSRLLLIHMLCAFIAPGCSWFLPGWPWDPCKHSQAGDAGDRGPSCWRRAA